MQKGELRLAILEDLLDAARTTAEIIDEFFSAFGSYTATPYKRLMGIEPRRKKRPISPRQLARKITYEEMHRFYDLLSKLKKDGLILKEKRRNSFFWRITKKGRGRIQEILARQKAALPARARYKKEINHTIKIVIFDIPEAERRKRVWLRAVLKRLGFKKLQRSVWIGKVKLPEAFLEDLRRLHMLDYVEIFAITKTGSIKAIE